MIALVLCLVLFSGVAEAKPLADALLPGSKILVKKPLPTGGTRSAYFQKQTGKDSYLGKDAKRPAVGERFCEIANSALDKKFEFKVDGHPYNVEDVKVTESKHQGDITSVYSLDNWLSYVRCYAGAGNKQLSLEDFEEILGDYFELVPLEKVSEKVKQAANPVDQSKNGVITDKASPKKLQKKAASDGGSEKPIKKDSRQDVSR